MKDFDFIREFGKIKITDCCKSVKVDVANLYNKKTTVENAKKGDVIALRCSLKSDSDRYAVAMVEIK